MNIITHINEIQSHILTQEDKIKKSVEKNCVLIRALASIRTELERSLKNPKNLNQAVYNSINICRENLLYTEMSTGVNKFDPPLTEEEKTLPNLENNQ